MLVAGLAVFGLASVAAALCTTADQLIPARAAMRVGAAMVYPTTLSILTNVFTERGERAKAIGIWAAVSGMGVAVGPISAGWLLEHFEWGSIFWLKALLAVPAIALALWIAPTSRDPSAPQLDRVGIVFLITQHFQFLKGYGPFETGLSILPVAGSIAAGSVLGPLLALRAGTKVIVASGLGLLAVAFAWISTVSVGTGYLEIALQMVVLGTGLGFVAAGACLVGAIVAALVLPAQPAVTAGEPVPATSPAS